jgi:hypothetical protein
VEIFLAVDAYNNYDTYIWKLNRKDSLKKEKSFAVSFLLLKTLVVTVKCLAFFQNEFDSMLSEMRSNKTFKI